MSAVRLELLHFEGCPLAPRARARVAAALATLDADAMAALQFSEVDLLEADTSEAYRRWGSPTLLLNGRDITGAPPADACGCRIYDAPGGVPSVDHIVSAINGAVRS